MAPIQHRCHKVPKELSKIINDSTIATIKVQTGLAAGLYTTQDQYAQTTKTTNDKLANMLGQLALWNHQSYCEKCEKHTIYGRPGDARPSRCKHHKGDGMLNIVSKRCAVEDCMKRPSFGKSSDKRSTHCAEHKEQVTRREAQQY